MAERFVRLREPVVAGGQLWGANSMVDTHKYPEVMEALKAMKAKRKIARAPRDKMVRETENK